MSGIIEQPRFSCALAAQQTVAAIPNAHPIVHAGPGCSSKAHEFAGTGAGFQGEGFAGGATVSCTNTSEQEVVFGGERKLEDTINGALKVLNGDLFVVLTGCTADIVGDDSIGVAKRFAAQGYPVVGTETAGFKGNTYYGHNVVLREIINQFVGNAEPNVDAKLVNVFSVVPFQDPYWRGDLIEIKKLLEKIGLKVNILFGSSSDGVSEWKNIPNAKFNLLISPWVGLDAVKLLERKYKTPYLHYPVLPVGAKETSKFLREVAEFAGIDKNTVEKVIANEERIYYDYFLSKADFIAEFRNSLPSELFTVADSTYAIGVSNYLVNELGFIPKGIYITDSPADKYKEELNNILVSKGEEFTDTLTIEYDGGLIQEDIKNKIERPEKTVILGSSWEKFLALDLKSKYVYLSLPLNETVIVNKSFVGYDGGLRLFEEVYGSVFKSSDSVVRGISGSR
ncbi:MAG: hydrogenase [Firmicutes bacterium]|nr:hydrogenase [Bacillota bacterium]